MTAHPAGMTAQSIRAGPRPHTSHAGLTADADVEIERLHRRLRAAAATIDALGTAVNRLRAGALALRQENAELRRQLEETATRRSADGAGSSRPCDAG